MGISNRTMGHTGLAPALVLLLAVASAGLSHENPVALLQESTEQASTAGAHETVHTKKPKAPLTAAEKRHIQRDVAHDAQGVLQERAGAVDDKALLAAAQEQVDTAVKVSAKQVQHRVKSQVRAETKKAQLAADDSHMESLIEQLEATAGIRSAKHTTTAQHAQLGGSAGSKSLHCDESCRRALEQHRLKNKAKLQGAETVHKAELKAHALALKAQADQVKRESAATVHAAKKQAQAEVNAVQDRLSKQSELTKRVQAAKAKVLDQLESSERLVEDLKVERKFRKETEAAAAELKKHTKTKKVEEKIVDPAPEVSMEKLETKLDELERVADEPLPELVTSEQIARAQEEAASGQPSAAPVGGTEQVTADSLEAQALKRRHIDLENSVHEASRVSGEQLAAEAEAKRAQVHLEKLSENDVNNIARQVPNTK